jgi:hypothetical protein
MTVTYPSIEPDARTFTPGGYAVTEPSHLGVQDAPRVWGNQPSEAELDLEYEYIDETNTNAILNAWNYSLSGFIKLTLPAEVSCGITDTDFADRITGTNAYSWFFAEEPRITSRKGKRANISVKLVGRIVAP